MTFSVRFLFYRLLYYKHTVYSTYNIQNVLLDSVFMLLVSLLVNSRLFVVKSNVIHGFSTVQGVSALTPTLFEGQQLGVLLLGLWQRPLGPCKCVVHFCHRFNVYILGMDYV